MPALIAVPAEPDFYYYRLHIWNSTQCLFDLIYIDLSLFEGWMLNVFISKSFQNTVHSLLVLTRTCWVWLGAFRLSAYWSVCISKPTEPKAEGHALTQTCLQRLPVAAGWFPVFLPVFFLVPVKHCTHLDWQHSMHSHTQKYQIRCER